MVEMKQFDPEDAYHIGFMIMFHVFISYWIEFDPVYSLLVDMDKSLPSYELFLWFLIPFVIGPLASTWIMFIEQMERRYEKPTFGYEKVEKPTTDLREVYDNTVIREMSTETKSAKIVEEDGKEVLYERS